MEVTRLAFEPIAQPLCRTSENELVVGSCAVQRRELKPVKDTSLEKAPIQICMHIMFSALASWKSLCILNH
jgi:hypothetical protein